MIGAMSSSLALAQRTATKARATMDDMSRQIATGQKVASVKDDGAGWTRANELRGNAQAREGLADLLNYQRSGVRWARESGEGRLIWLEEARQSAMNATLDGQSVTTIEALEQSHSEARDAFNQYNYAATDVDLVLGRTSRRDWDPFSQVGALQNSHLSFITDISGSMTTWYLTSGVRLGATTALTESIATTAQADTAAATWQGIGDDVRGILADLGGLERRLDGLATFQSSRADAELTQAASLSEVDLGKASAARAQADTRQQLALQTIQQALSAYGNYAGGLLGNVQRTQRGVLA